MRRIDDLLFKRLPLLEKEDRDAVNELLSIAGSPDCKNQHEVLAVLFEVLLPDCLADDEEAMAREAWDAGRELVCDGHPQIDGYRPKWKTFEEWRASRGKP